MKKTKLSRYLVWQNIWNLSYMTGILLAFGSSVFPLGFSSIVTLRVHGPMNTALLLGHGPP